MLTIPAKELKRRGVAAIEDLIEEGPVEIIKNNRPACVVLSVGQYRELTEKRRPQRGKRRPTVSELFALPSRGTKKRAEIDAELRAERESWGER